MFDRAALVCEIAGAMAESAAPAWLDRRAYPFRSRYLELEMGRLHYVDEGVGKPLLMVHGQPTWSFLFREQVRALSAGYRCVALDLIGFGLSDKPAGWTYWPEDHAAVVGRLVEELDLEEVTLLVHDWGGPIGLGWAARNPERVARLVILNTWMWSMADVFWARVFSGLLGSAAGRWLTRRRNLFVRDFMSRALSPERWREVSSQYEGPLARPEDRTGEALFPRQIIAATPWLEQTWELRGAIADRPTLLVWGMRDPVFRPDVLARLAAAFPHHRIERQAEVGHFVSEEMGPGLAKLIGDFVAV